MLPLPLVYLIFLVETVATALNGVDMYYWFAAGFGDILNFAKPRISPFYTPILGSVMALVVQVFFCYRIYIIKPAARWFCIFISLVSEDGLRSVPPRITFSDFFSSSCWGSWWRNLSLPVRKRST
jgi:hypothetical protein